MGIENETSVATKEVKVEERRVGPSSVETETENEEGRKARTDEK